MARGWGSARLGPLGAPAQRVLVCPGYTQQAQHADLPLPCGLSVLSGVHPSRWPRSGGARAGAPSPDSLPGINRTPAATWSEAGPHGTSRKRRPGQGLVRNHPSLAALTRSSGAASPPGLARTLAGARASGPSSRGLTSRTGCTLAESGQAANVPSGPAALSRGPVGHRGGRPRAGRWTQQQPGGRLLICPSLPVRAAAARVGHIRKQGGDLPN